MKAENRILFLCCRQTFADAHRQEVARLCIDGAIDWEQVLTVAELHGVAPLLYHHLMQGKAAPDLPADVAGGLQRSYLQNVMEKERMALKLRDLLQFCNERRMEVMLIKGAALDLTVYEAPWYTANNDMDLVIRERTAGVGDADLERVIAPRQGLIVEWDYFAHHDVTMNGTLPVDFGQIWRDAQRVPFRGTKVWVMAPEDELIALCINSCRKRFFRLKALCDIGELVEKAADMNWEVFVAKTRTYGCQNIVYAALLATQLTRGCELPYGLLDTLGVGLLRKHVIGALCVYFSERGSLASLAQGKRFFGRRVNAALALPYATFGASHVWRRLAYFWRTRTNPQVTQLEAARTGS